MAKGRLLYIPSGEFIPDINREEINFLKLLVQALTNKPERYREWIEDHNLQYPPVKADFEIISDD